MRLWSAAKRAVPWTAGLLAPLARRLRPRVAAYQSNLAVDWSRTRAVPWGFHGQVRLNIQGRDPAGIVPPGQVAPLLRRIEELLGSLNDPVDGRPVYS